MRSNDLQNQREALRDKLQQAIKDNNMTAFGEAMDSMMETVAQAVREDFEDLRNEQDMQVLAARGVRQLTSKENEYYQALIGAMRSESPQQALANLSVVMPETVIDAVFEDLASNHPLLSRINFMATAAKIKMLLNTNGYQEAVWGDLCEEIVKELASGFKEVDSGLKKLSAFLPVCKDMLELGPQWLDNYVRQVLYEALANGLEVGIITGTGNKEAIGMTRQVGDGVTVTGGVYPEKTKIAVNDLSAATIGNLLSLMAMDPNGKGRVLRDVILLVNPQDYYQRVMPATTLMAPDGSYRNDVLPYPIDIIQSPALERGEAVIGMGYKYFAAAGIGKEGRIEYSDHYRFLEDQRVYLIKAYANGMPLDNNAFLHLDISGLQAATWKVTMVDETTPSTDATLSDLRIGSLTLTPAFGASTTSYTAATTNATNTVTAVPADAGANVDITVGDDPLDNGTAATWASGANTVEVVVTAADGLTSKTYTVTVTKS